MVTTVQETQGGTFGFQAEMGLDGLRRDPVPARLDKGGITSHFSAEPSGEAGVQLPLWYNQRKELRGHHARLVTLLRSMETGEHGLAAQVVADKWLHDVERCPGNVRRHKVCSRVSFYPYSCDFPLCPWCQHRRSDAARRKLSGVAGLLKEPKLLTLSPPNVAEFTSGAVAGMAGAFSMLRRRKVLQGVRGGIRSVETTYGENGWNLHLHALLDGPFTLKYPTWDIAWAPQWDITWADGRWVVVKEHGRWVVVKKHPGLAREFTAVCQKFSALRAPRLDFNIDCPEHWYFVDIRQADSGAVAEVVKYIAKGSEIVNGGPGAVVAFLKAIKGRRMIQAFGSLFDVDLEPEPDEGYDPGARGECPYEDCPAPAVHEWEFINFGPGDWVLDRDSRTGSYRAVPDNP